MYVYQNVWIKKFRRSARIISFRIWIVSSRSCKVHIFEAFSLTSFILNCASSSWYPVACCNINISSHLCDFVRKLWRSKIEADEEAKVGSSCPGSSLFGFRRSGGKGNSFVDLDICVNFIGSIGRYFRDKSSSLEIAVFFSLPSIDRSYRPWLMSCIVAEILAVPFSPYPCIKKWNFPATSLLLSSVFCSSVEGWEWNLDFLLTAK